MADTAEQLAAWDTYLADPSMDNRKALATAYVPLVRHIAGQIHSKIPRQAIARYELESEGMFGLIDAIGKFDPSRGAHFDSYAGNRIRGAILDGLRRADHLPRSIRDSVRAVDRANDHGVNPSEELGLQGRELADELALVERARVGSLEQARDEQGEAGVPVEDVGLDEPWPFEDVAIDIAAVVAGLPARQQQLICRYYLSQRSTLRTVGEQIGINESRCVQLHDDALLSIRSWLLREPAINLLVGAGRE